MTNDHDYLVALNDMDSAAQVPGYPHYMVTIFGEVFSCASGKWKRHHQFDNKAAGNLYKRTELCRNGKRKKFYVHRLIMLAFVGECPKGKEVSHVDGDTFNNYLANLRYETKKQNAQRRY